MEQLLAKAQHLAWRRIGNETILLDTRNRRMVAVNEDGAGVLELLDRPRSLAGLLRLAALGGEPRGRRDSLIEFVDQLKRAGCLVDVDDSEVGAEDDLREASSIPSHWSPRILWQESLQEAVHQFQAYAPFDLQCQ